MPAASSYLLACVWPADVHHVHRPHTWTWMLVSNRVSWARSGPLMAGQRNAYQLCRNVCTGVPLLDAVVGLALSSAVARTGVLETSDPRVNALLSNIYWTQRRGEGGAVVVCLLRVKLW